MLCSLRRRGPLAAVGRAIAPIVLAVPPLLAQPAAPPPPRPPQPAPAHDRWSADRWSAAFDYLHLGAAPIRRRAEPSMDVTLGRALGAGDPARAPRLEAGWLRASRVTTQAQGATLGMSVGLPFGRRSADDASPRRPALTLRPGAAVLAGWAEAQDSAASYAWQGLPNTPYAGQTGTAVTYRPVRGRTMGAGLSLGADLWLTRAVAVTGSVRQWAFTGPVIRPNRHATLAGVGVAIRPNAFAADARAWWHHQNTKAPQTAERAHGLRPTVPQDAGASPSAVTTPAAGGSQ